MLLELILRWLQRVIQYKHMFWATPQCWNDTGWLTLNKLSILKLWKVAVFSAWVPKMKDESQERKLLKQSSSTIEHKWLTGEWVRFPWETWSTSVQVRGRFSIPKYARTFLRTWRVRSWQVRMKVRSTEYVRTRTAFGTLVLRNVTPTSGTPSGLWVRPG